jgi:hypothetical protein
MQLNEINNIKEDITELQNLMEKNVDQVLRRGEKIEILEDKSNELKQNSYLLSASAHELKIKYQAKNYALTFILSGIVGGALFGLGSNMSLMGIAIGSFIGGIGGYGVNCIRVWLLNNFFPKQAWFEPEQSTNPNELSYLIKSKAPQLLDATPCHKKPIISRLVPQTYQPIEEENNPISLAVQTSPVPPLPLTQSADDIVMPSRFRSLS